MKREIKFRCKLLDNGEWIYGSLVIINGRTFIFNDDMRKEVDPKTVGQYTGWKDKNGREIYEGDIVEISPEIADPIHNTSAIAIVHFKYGQYFVGSDVVRWMGLFELRNFIAVIGNIHDNPELLEGKE